jgi:alpha-D-xyloside xylohydrolase
MFLNYPDDPTTWAVEDQFMFGEDLLIAPIMEESCIKRKVYLPKGKWIDYQTHEVYEGEKWQTIFCHELPGIVLVKNGSVIPHIALAQSTEFMNWENIELVVFDTENKNIKGFFYDPSLKIHQVELVHRNDIWKVASFSDRKIKLDIRSFDE